ncbi:hypothetical protein [Flavobacterium subsaxonicum]|uniref:Beta-lactamase-inhibitor-like PepSY-like domain-containing protein n=1 Tax=Flavobacterium subsaxonicum WB 4.1-42 = DSM 21790 TaxID=1121898 RepID=A0A0A2N365_9FLAO|nr:hypothetical protein [Flavobacterium subsaxonicum]KGO94900.1 hypothetical protein Q766_01940 [Flavobacterium subsaxonicum WB 4.1-42 = DSM 21790]
MKKLLLGALMVLSLSLSAQTSEKNVPLSRKDYDTFMKIKGISFFKNFEDVPEEVTQVTAGTTVTKTTAKTAQYQLTITPDGEWQFAMTAKKQTYYLRFISGNLIGYSLFTQPNGETALVYYDNSKVVFQENLKVVK